MFKKEEYVVYKRDVCQIKEIKNNYYNDNAYYILQSITDPSLVIDIPTANKAGYLRKLISKSELEDIINQIPSIEIIDCSDKVLENQYRQLLNSGEIVDLIKIIKTAYLRNKERLDNNKKIGDKDNNYFEKAESFLYNEFSIVLGLSYEDTKKYVVDKVTKLEKV